MENKQERREKKLMSPVQEIPILNFDLRTKQSNIMEVKTALATYSYKQYKTLGNCIEDLTLSDIPEIDTRTITSEMEYAVFVRKRIEKVDLRAQELTHLYGVVLGMLSITSREKVINAAEFQRIKETNDGFRLWCLIYKLHVRGQETTSVAERYNVAERNYVNCIQREGEPLAEFYERFKACVKVMRQLTADESRNIRGSPSDSLAAAKFISNLNRNLYGELQRVLHNSGDYPATLPDALERAGSYEPLTKTWKSQKVNHGAAVFNTHAKNQNARKSKTKFAGKCFNCGKMGHKATDCKSKKKPAAESSEAKSTFTVEFESEDEGICTFTVLSGMNSKKEFDDFELLLDSGAQINVVKNRELLRNLRRSSPIKLHGMNDTEDGISCDTVGDLLGFGEAYFCAVAKANLLSVAAIRGNCQSVSFDNEKNEFIVIDKDSKRFVFSERDNIYRCNVGSKHTFSMSKKEIETMKLVRDIQRRLGYESDHGLKIALKNGSINNMPITTRDIDNATSYFGKDIGMLKGKTTATPPVIYSSVEVNKYSDVPQELEVDLFHVDGHLFLASVSDPLDLVMVNYLSERSNETISLNAKQIDNVRNHLFNQLDNYRNEGFKVVTLRHDSESVLKSLSPELMREGYRVEVIHAGRHGVPRMDRKIRMIKERCRCIFSTLPYQVPKILIPWCVKFVTSRINLIRRRESTLLSNESPREAFTGKKTDFQRDVRIGFGEYVQVVDINLDNSMRERTLSCLSLMPLMNGSGGVKFYCLKTKAIIERDSWINVPIPDTVIEYLNKMAEPGRKKKVNRDPTFHYEDEQHEDCDESEVIDESNPGIEVITPQPIDQEHVLDGREVETPMVEERAVDQPDTNEANEEISNPQLDESAVEERHDQNSSATTSSSLDPFSTSPNTSEGPNIVESVRSRGNRFGFRRFFEGEVRGAFNLTMKQATSLFGDIAKESIRLEMQQMIEKCVWKPIFWNTVDTNVIPFKMFLKEKNDSNGVVTKIKARLVAGGHLQNREDLFDKSSPTLMYPSLLILSLLAAKFSHCRDS